MPCTGRLLTAKTTASPLRSGTTSARDLHARPLLGQHELAAVEIRARLRQQDRDLQREDMLAVEILVQAVVVARAIAQQQRRRPRLAGRVAALEERGVVGGEARRPCPCARASDWRSARAADRGAVRRSSTRPAADRRNSVFAAPEAVPGHDHVAAEAARRRRRAPAMRVAFLGRDSSPGRIAQPWASRSADDGRPVDRRHAIAAGARRRALMPRPPGRAARACAARPSDSPKSIRRP